MRTANEIFNALNDNYVIKWEGLSDGGKWTRAIEAINAARKEAIEECAEQVKVFVDKDKILQLLKDLK